MDFFARHALLPAGWARDVRVSVSGDGIIRGVRADAAPEGAEYFAGPLLPGMPNLHSHAFQRAMAGLAEVAGAPADSFWSWRRRMYDLVARITPEHVQAVAAYLYMEMLKAGYTSVAEFHYLHHDGGGLPYANPAETSERLLAAAESAGIAQTLLPVLYSYGGFGAQAPGSGQRRFLLDSDAYAHLWQTLQAHIQGRRQQLGLCFHSLRAVSAEQIESVLQLDQRAPVHIHVAEQQGEVDACLAWSGQRPVDWLYDHVDVGPRWCLIHATHTSAAELQRIARSGAVAGLCPTTEANLGDGVFPAADYVAAGGRFGIGSDSHVGVSAAEELRWLEYAQRLVSQHRNRLADTGTPSVGHFLYGQALAGGAQALGQPLGRIEPGTYADCVVLDGEHPFVAASEPEQLLGRWLFAHGNALVRDVYVGGRKVIEAGRHPREREFAADFRRALAALG